MIALFGLFKRQHVVPSVSVLQNEKIIASSEACVSISGRVRVRILQLYAQRFSALSGFTPRLMTPTAFVPIQCILKREFPRQFHLWLWHVFTWPVSSIFPIVLWLTCANDYSVIAVNKSLPLCNLQEEENETMETITQGVDQKQDWQHKWLAHNATFIQSHCILLA